MNEQNKKQIMDNVVKEIYKYDRIADISFIVWLVGMVLILLILIFLNDIPSSQEGFWMTMLWIYFGVFLVFGGVFINARSSLKIYIEFMVDEMKEYYDPNFDYKKYVNKYFNVK